MDWWGKMLVGSSSVLIGAGSEWLSSGLIMGRDAF